jgi:ATP-dependent helicase/nuclease subunit B
VFLRLALTALAEALAPVPLLALLKHPLTTCGMAPENFRALTRRLEHAVLRGPRPAPGLPGLAAAVRGLDAALGGFVAALGRALAPLAAALAARQTGLVDLAAAHVAAAEALAESDTEAGAARLWREPAGEAAAQTMNELLDAAADAPPLDGGDYPALFEALLSGRVVRPPYGRHPRLFIWGLLEARLQRADRIVLGGLNEGVWPPASDSDPWLSRPMRATFGLPPPERRVGAAAHDFAQAFGAPDVVLTRAARVEGAPTVPSRWLLRLDTVLRAAGHDGALLHDAEPLAWQARLDAAARIPPHPPEPRPPVAARPRALSVTQIETWRRDPYAIYARHVLRLKALEPLDADPGAADRGNFIHQALDRFLREFPLALPEDGVARLLAFGRESFGAALDRPGVAAFWWPRFERIAEWYVAREAARRGSARTLASECRGRLTLSGPAGRFDLTAIADRIDRLDGGALAIVDYKTGTLPKVSDVALGYAPQLALEAAIAEAGGFTGIPAAPVASLSHWQLSGGDPPGSERDIDPDELRARIDEARAGLEALIARFDDIATPYRSVPRPDAAPRYSDYDHLARVKEWSVAGGDGE